MGKVKSIKGDRVGEITNKIVAKEFPICEILNKKYVIDDYQREYRWTRKHIEALICDLEAAFYVSYKPTHAREDVAAYNSYYLGPVVMSEKEGKRAIIDGQQRLTSITLLLIYLQEIQSLKKDKVDLTSLIYSEKYGKKSFNLEVPERQVCLNEIFTKGRYDISEEDDESTINLVDRFMDIHELFPDDLKDEALPYFIDWLIGNVILVVITAYTDENAYTIFETMNDRGLNLTASEMLKGYVLSKILGADNKKNVNEIWKKEIKKLHEYEKDEDLKFFQAWLRAKYAITIRQGKAGSANEDFEKIGTRFHTWIKDNQIALGLKHSNDFLSFMKDDFSFFSRLYRKLSDCQLDLTKGLEHVYYSNEWGIAASLADPLFLSPVLKTDSEEIINQKLDLVGRFIETFAVYRAVNFRSFSASSIRYTMCNLVLEVRNKDVSELRKILKSKLEAMPENMSGIKELRMHGQNKSFIKFFLARITSYLEKNGGNNSSVDHFLHNEGGKPYEIEHIWADKMSYHKDEFTQTEDFSKFRNMIGGLLLLPKGTNQSFNDDPYDKKVQHYVKENILARSLNAQCYEKNPNFLNFIKDKNLAFVAHSDFKKKDLLERQSLYEEIAKNVWCLSFFD